MVVSTLTAKIAKFFSVKFSSYRYCEHFVWSWMYFCMIVYNQNPWNVKAPVFCKADGFPSPNSIWTVQNPLDNPDTHLPLPYTRLCTNTSWLKDQGIILSFCFFIIRQQRKIWPQSCSTAREHITTSLNYRLPSDTQQWSQWCPL